MGARTSIGHGPKHGTGPSNRCCFVAFGMWSTEVLVWPGSPITLATVSDATKSPVQTGGTVWVGPGASMISVSVLTPIAVVVAKTESDQAMAVESVPCWISTTEVFV
ncbi:hypothetical protein JCM33374_g3372 [Metschnikowia sp. JCM 33374]|nr:hypothetical protein JCM33374_g3372 [Metschnikowia sp. JCM 33374]